MTNRIKVTRWIAFAPGSNVTQYAVPEHYEAENGDPALHVGCWELEMFKGPNPRRDGVFMDLCRNPQTALRLGRRVATWYAKQNHRGMRWAAEHCKKYSPRWPV